MDFVRATAIAALLAMPWPALAHDPADHAKRASISTKEHPFGVEGDPRRASRSVALTTDDTMRYSQSQIRVAQGETITFVVTNKGKLMHEFVLGTEDGLTQHAEMMRKNPGMAHDDPYMAHVKPGATERVTWTDRAICRSRSSSCSWHSSSKARAPGGTAGDVD